MEDRQQQCGCVERHQRQSSGLALRHLQELIKDRSLCDPSNIIKTHHENDISDLSEGEQVIVSPASRKPNRKRKRANLTDVSCSSQSSGTCSPLNIPWCLGFIGRTGFESNESDCSNRSKPVCTIKGYDTATTAVITDSEDDFYFPNEGREFDEFEIEYEPPESNSEDEKDDDDDEEPQIIISSDEDPGADGGDEYDEDDIDSDSDSEDAWECVKCKVMNHPMTRHCVQCWGQRTDWLPQLSRTFSAPVRTKTEDFNFPTPTLPGLRRGATVPAHHTHFENAPATSTDGKNSWQIHVPIPTAAGLQSFALAKDCETSSRSSSSCSNTHQSCDSGICVSSCETDNEHAIQLSGAMKLERNVDSAFVPSGKTSITPFGVSVSTADITANKTVSVQENANSLEIIQDSSNLTPSASQETELTFTAISVDTGIAPPIEEDHLNNEKSDQEAINKEDNSAKTEERCSAASNPALLPSSPRQQIAEEAFNKDVCVICLSQPRNASIIHGHSGHQVCCISCAEKLKANKKKCPVCRRKIHFVVKNFL